MNAPAPGPPRTIVKVCGLTRLQDAHEARKAGADWLGFVVYGESPRRVRPEYMSNVMTTLPGMTGVAVMVGVTPDEALDLARRSGAKRVQLHRVDPATWPTDFPLPVAFAVPVSAEGRVEGTLPRPHHLLMLDTAHPDRAGGTGERFEWRAVATLAASRPVLLAGGLDASVVAEALEQTNPFGVDASSRLEREPGIKDLDKLWEYVTAVREWDARHQHRA